LRQILIATRNSKKLKEIRRLLKGIGVRVRSLDGLYGLPKVKEDGKTFNANARKKAVEISSRLDMLVMADDSGLEVPALGYEPGINSARYAGPKQDDKKNIAKLLKAMKRLTGIRRRARFRCVICISKGRKVIRMIEGKVDGYIISEPMGLTGFGYDPVFIPEKCKKTFAQLGPASKDRISHRAKALREAKKVIQQYFRKYP
jgi:XTP/dITP diphosphohydrolase